MKAAFYTLGCKVNQYETQILEQSFSENGYEIVSAEEAADVYVINSCTVTSSGDKKTRQALRRFKRNNPGAVTALTGCFPQAFPDAAQRIPEADVITGSHNRGGLLLAVQKFLQTGQRVVQVTPHRPAEAFESMSAKGFLDRTRAFIKIEDGCDRYCSYCIIPTARGPIRSKPLAELKTELAGLSAAGYREVVLVGINLSSYGKETGEHRLCDAVELACATPGIARVRLGSLEPELLTEDDIARMAAQPKFCPQFHLSLQSGCKETLHRMNRHYTPQEYAQIVANLRVAFPNASITTDMMVGFAGETEEEFLQSVAFARQIGFAKVHVFPYSIREGTRAADMPNQVPQQQKERRAAELTQAMQEVRSAFLKTQVGRTEEVLFETTQTPFGVEGYTKNYTPVRVLAQNDLRGCLCTVQLLSATDNFCIGRIFEEMP